MKGPAKKMKEPKKIRHFKAKNIYGTAWRKAHIGGKTIRKRVVIGKKQRFQYGTARRLWKKGYVTAPSQMRTLGSTFDAYVRRIMKNNHYKHATWRFYKTIPKRLQKVYGESTHKIMHFGTNKSRAGKGAIMS